MPENQNEWGESWNQQLNGFLKTVMRWEQLGVSNIDITNPITGKPRGLDSVFSYKRNPISNQEIVLVEAKTVEKLQNINKYKIEGWIGVLLDKLESLPNSEDFLEKFRPETNASCKFGLIGLWVRDIDTYSETQIQEWLSRLDVPSRRRQYYIGFVSNKNFNLLYAVHREIERLRGIKEYSKVHTYFPYFGDKPKIEGDSYIFETFFSKFVFYRATKLQTIKGKGEENPYLQNIIFYLGDIENYDDLSFIGEAMLRFDLFQQEDIVIYTLNSKQKLRSEIEQFKKEFIEKSASCQIEFEQLILSEELPNLE